MMNTAASTQIVPGFGVTEITSDPNGAEIFLDDKFVSSSPATLRVAEGAHSNSQVRASLRLESCHNYPEREHVTAKATLDPI
jgi:hypothetical protein